MTRRAFTLLEVMVALVVTSVVVVLAYSTAQVGLDTGSRLASYRAEEQSAQVVRAMLSDALRHAVVGTRGGERVFELFSRDGREGAGDSLRFASRGIVSPLGTSEVWDVSVWQDDDGLHVEGAPHSTLGDWPLHMRLPRATSFEVAALGRGADATWRDGWSEATVTPDAVSFEIGGVEAPSDTPTHATRTVVRMGLERQP